MYARYYTIRGFFIIHAVSSLAEAYQANRDHNFENHQRSNAMPLRYFPLESCPITNYGLFQYPARTRVPYVRYSGIGPDPPTRGTTRNPWEIDRTATSAAVDGFPDGEVEEPTPEPHFGTTTTTTLSPTTSLVRARPEWKYTTKHIVPQIVHQVTVPIFFRNSSRQPCRLSINCQVYENAFGQVCQSCICRQQYAHITRQITSNDCWYSTRAVKVTGENSSDED